MTTPLPDFHSTDFLRRHIAHTMAFYRPHALDPSGGFFHYFRDDGTVYDRAHRHLVSSTRFVFNHAMAAREFGRAEDVAAARHGLAYLRKVHRDPATGGYAWTVRDGVPEDRMNHCYGVAFVLLAYASALKAGIEEARPWIDETWQLLERHYWEPQHQLYRDEASADWVFTGYRGQNANMHMTEAMIAAHEATGEARFLDRAVTLARRMTQDQAALAGGLVWEHYDAAWNIDWDYHRDDPKHLFRPWGFQPGHQTEWAKLLLQIDALQSASSGTSGREPEPWLVPTAQRLFDRAVAAAWDPVHGGLAYGFAPDGTVCDDDKYFWVQAESLAAAARLAVRLKNAHYWQWYDKLWAYAWAHFVDHEHGAWYRLLSVDNRKLSDEKSPAGKTDYHTMGACYEVLGLLRAPVAPR